MEILNPVVSSWPTVKVGPTPNLEGLEKFQEQEGNKYEEKKRSKKMQTLKKFNTLNTRGYTRPLIAAGLDSVFSLLYLASFFFQPPPASSSWAQGGLQRGSL